MIEIRMRNTGSRFPRRVPTHAEVPVVPCRGLPAGVGVHVRSQCERTAPLLPPPFPSPPIPVVALTISTSTATSSSVCTGPAFWHTDQQSGHYAWLSLLGTCHARFAADLSTRCVPFCRRQPWDARRRGRYGLEGQFAVTQWYLGCWEVAALVVDLGSCMFVLSGGTTSCLNHGSPCLRGYPSRENGLRAAEGCMRQCLAAAARATAPLMAEA